MKKIIIGIILGGILFGSGVYAASYYAKDVTYTPTDESWEVSNVEDALNDLYNSSKGKSTLIGTYTEDTTINVSIYEMSDATKFVLVPISSADVKSTGTTPYAWFYTGTLTLENGTLTVSLPYVRVGAASTATTYWYSKKIECELYYIG